eukprot:CAMPEP_0183493430 /NCGR_PEP_ID=MMETSP0370-20130417/183444_1 /TAXON_ID=268820 /ORGANISM="Peridinium aciculiferum, Strain PAER-2" /LENGTH=447 /DNA_ID=CAMNT_0025686773 /DNA_START=9 /DNA_END=1353 /DNA_ORIENTATION=-
MLKTVYDRVRGKDQIEALEAELAQVNKLMADAAERADKLQTSMQKELDEERKIMKELSTQIMDLQKAYETLSDDTELEQTQSAEKLQQLMESLDQANSQLRLTRDKKTEIEGRLSKTEQDEARIAKELEALIHGDDKQDKELKAFLIQQTEQTNAIKADMEKLLGELEASGTTADKWKEKLLIKMEANKKLRQENDSMKTESDKQDKELKAFLIQQTEQTNAIKAYDEKQMELVGMLSKAEQDEARIAKELEALIQQLAEANEQEAHVVSELAAKEQDNQKLNMEVASKEATSKKLVADMQKLLDDLEASGTTAGNLNNELFSKEEAIKVLMQEVDSMKTESDKHDKELETFLMQQTEQTNAIKAYEVQNRELMDKLAALEKEKMAAELSRTQIANLALEVKLQATEEKMEKLLAERQAKPDANKTIFVRATAKAKAMAQASPPLGA